MHGHVDAVLHLEQKIQPGLRNSSGKTAPEVWCSLLPAASSPYPDVRSAQQSKVRRHEEANRLVSKLDDFLKKASDFVGWRTYLSEWKAAGRIDAHANSVMFDVIFKLHDSIYLVEFHEDESLQNLSMMFELLAQFAQESFGLLVQKAQTAAVVEQEKQKTALRFLDKVETMFERSISRKLLGIEMSVSVCLLKNAIRSFPVVVSGGGLTKSQQHLLQTMGFELFLALGCVAGGDLGDSLMHICNLACLMLSEVQACESNDWMVAACEMSLACIGCQHPDLEKAENSFQILQKHLNKYSSFLTRRFSLLIQGVSALYKVARFSPHPSIRLRAAIGRCELDPHDSPRSSAGPLHDLNAVTFDAGDTVVLRRSDGTSSTLLRKIPTCSRDGNVWTYPTFDIGNNDSRFTITFLKQVTSQRKQDAGAAFALVRVQPKVPALSTFASGSNVDAVQGVEGYFQLQYLAIKQKVADRSRGRSPSPPPPAASSDQRATVTISIKTLTSNTCFFRNFKNDRVRGYSALMLLRLYHNLSSESSDDPSDKSANAVIVQNCIETIDEMCSGSFNHHLRADLEHLRQLRQPGHAVATAPAVLHDSTFDPIDPLLDVTTCIARRRSASTIGAEHHAPKHAAYAAGGSGPHLHVGGGGGALHVGGGGGALHVGGGGGALHVGGGGGALHVGGGGGALHVGGGGGALHVGGGGGALHVGGGGGALHVGGGGGAPSALEEARLLWQLSGNVSDPVSPPPAAMPAAAVASAPPMDHSYQSADVSPHGYNPQAVPEEQHWMQLPPGWQRVRAVDGTCFALLF
jgi:hypothetical protein